MTRFPEGPRVRQRNKNRAQSRPRSVHSPYPAGQRNASSTACRISTVLLDQAWLAYAEGHFCYGKSAVRPAERTFIAEWDGWARCLPGALHHDCDWRSADQYLHTTAVHDRRESKHGKLSPNGSRISHSCLVMCEHLFGASGYLLGQDPGSCPSSGYSPETK